MSERAEKSAGPHQGQPVLVAGEPLDKATTAMVMLHGRGATAEDILELAAEFKQPGFAYMAPQAARNSWYPNSFLAPIPSNEPGLSSGLAVIATILAQLAEAGIPASASCASMVAMTASPDESPGSLLGMGARKLLGYQVFRAACGAI